MTDDEDFSQLTQQRLAAFNKLTEGQRDLCHWRRWCVTVSSDGTLVFGMIPDRWEVDLMHDREFADLTDFLLTQGSLYGLWSSMRDEGSWGTNHALGCWPINEQLYNAARDLGWDYAAFHPALAGEFDVRLNQMQEHFEQVRSQQ